MKIIYCLFICFLFFAVGCKKNGDIITTGTIHGQVYNICNDSGLANIPVYIQENGVNIAQTVSGANGSFTFTNVKTHSSEAYGYLIYIYSRGAASMAFDGASVAVPNFPTTLNYVVKVKPRLNFWKVYFPNTTFLATDTYNVVYQQHILHNNLANPNDNEWEASQACPCVYGSTQYLGNLSNFASGMWQITLNRTKNGVHTTQTDSFYVGWGAIQTDTLYW